MNADLFSKGTKSQNCLMNSSHSQAIRYELPFHKKYVVRGNLHIFIEDNNFPLESIPHTPQVHIVHMETVTTINS